MRVFKLKLVICAISLSILSTIATGCSPSDISSSSGGGFIPGSATTPAAGILVTATPLSVPTTNASTITAYVVDNIGSPIGGAQVSFSLSNPLYASLSAASATTGACPGATCGVATVTFTAGPVNTIITVTAAIGSVSGSAQVTITGGGGGGSVTVAANPSSITVGSNSTITATVRDGSNALVGGATVNFTLSNTSANFSGAATATATTGACPSATCGLATVTLTGTAASTVTVTATALGINGTANVTISPSTAIGTIIVTASPASIYTLGTSTISATLTDPGGNPWAGQTITFTLNNPAVATLSGPTAVTNASGVATVNLTAGSLPTSVIVTASFTTTSTISSTATVAIAVPPPASLTVVANPSSILVLGTTTITATVLDAGGNPVPDGTQVNFVLSDSSYGTLSNATSTTANTNGTATTTFIAGNKAGGVAITAISGSVSNNTSLNIVPAATGSIEFVSAAPQVVGIAGSGQPETSFVTFYVRDINGNAAADGTAVTFAMNGPGGGAYITGSVVGASVATSSSVNGSASVTLHSGTVAGPVTIIASTYVNSGDQTTLSGAIDAVVTTIPVAAGGTAGFPASGTLRIDNELITYGGIAGNTFTGCVRGSVSTLPASHLANAQVYGQTTISSSATQISIGGGVPSAGHWNLATSQFNLAGLLYSGLTATISGYIADRFGNYNILTGTSVSFYTEAGAIDRQGITDSTGKTSVVLRTQSPAPADVKNVRSSDADLGDFASYYSSNEPWYLGRPLNYNPRDGWVTVLATTMGEEAFLDENGDGMLTRSYCAVGATTCTPACPSGYTCECDNNGTPNTWAGSVTTGTDCSAHGGSSRRSEGFIDIGEPFYDKNDNSKRNDGSVSGYPFEEFIDANGDGGYDGPNGMWDGPECKSVNTAPTPDDPCLTSKMIWRSIKLVFTGTYYFWPLPDGNNCYSIAGGCTATYAAGSFAVAPASIQRGSSGTFCVRIGDVNLNSLPGGTEIVASATPAKSVTPSSVTLLDVLSTGPTNFCFVVSIDPSTTDSVTVVSAGVKDTPLASISVPITAPPLVITTTTLPAGTIGAAYNATLTATGGTPPYSWAVTAGTLPPGLSLNASSGAITGTPAGPAGTSNFTVTITDSWAATASRALSITIN